MVALVLLGTSLAVGFTGSAAADTKIDFEQFEGGTVVTTQYADAGGTGRGVVFGPLPGGAGDGLRPVVKTVSTGLARSGSNVADIGTCVGCEFFTPRTTGTFAVPRSKVSVHVGYLGDPASCTDADPNSTACAVVTMRAFDVNGVPVAESSARVTRGAGVRTLLSVSTSSPTIAGFEITGRPGTDSTKSIAIDDLSFGSDQAPAAKPDFTLNPALTTLALEQGGTVTDTVTIGRLNGSSGGVSLRVDGLPDGVSATFVPNPATGTQTVLTLSARPDAPILTKSFAVTGTPQAASTGTAARGFSLTVVVTPACPHVSTASELVDRVKQHFECIYVNDSAQIDLADVDDKDVSNEEVALVIPEGVTLMGGRGPTVPGGMLEMSHRGKKVMLSLGSSSRVTGLRLRGYNQTDRHARSDPSRAIAISGSTDVLVENNEIFGWPHSGVYVTGPYADRGAAPRVTRNFIHNNVQCGDGQGVQLAGKGFARIDHNLFDYNRHDVGSLWDADGYLAELNFSLTSGPKCLPGHALQYYNQHYDMHGQFAGYHGQAGTFVEIRRNTIRGAQEYYALYNRPAFWLRGTPRDKAIFRGNVVQNSDSFGRRGAVRLTAPVTNPFLGQQLQRSGKLVIGDNRLCFDTAGELAVGDFNGDGRDDVFQSVGTLWVYSPSGSREWTVLNDSTVRLANLALGDFDGDGKTDVFTQSGDQWLVSSGGTGASSPLPAGSNIPMKGYRFGDFDGDRKTDVFRANGAQWFYSSGGATSWRPLAVSRLGVGDLRFGDFDGNGTTDVFSLANGQWSVSDGGSAGWRRLNARLSSNLASLVFADFNGDHKTDIARSGSGNWQVSWGGSTGWQVLQFRRSESLGAGVLFGDFTGDGHDDVFSTASGHRLPRPRAGRPAAPTRGWSPCRTSGCHRPEPSRSASGRPRPCADPAHSS